jgi:hypothetical protein
VCVSAVCVRQCVEGRAQAVLHILCCLIRGPCVQGSFYVAQQCVVLVADTMQLGSRLQSASCARLPSRSFLLAHLTQTDACVQGGVYAVWAQHVQA